MNAPPDGIRKAAILVATLDRSAADRLLDQMEPAQARQVRQVTVELDRIDPAEQRQVVDEFFRARPLVRQKDPPGIELDGRLAGKLSLLPGRVSSGIAAVADEKALSSVPDGSRGLGGKPFRFLRDAEGEKLAGLLASERPQTIALVLAHLPPKQAGNVLVRLSPQLQVEVVRRLVDLEETEPEILREVERALESRFSEQVLMQRRRVAGLAAVAGIIEASEGPVAVEILGNLASHDRRLAERLSPERPQFSDLTLLDEATLATIFRAAGPELTTLALVDAPPHLIERIVARLPESQESFVRDRLANLGPMRLSDAEEARRRIAHLAHRLAIDGQIELGGRQGSIPRGNRHPQ